MNLIYWIHLLGMISQAERAELHVATMIGQSVKLSVLKSCWQQRNCPTWCWQTKWLSDRLTEKHTKTPQKHVGKLIIYCLVVFLLLFLPVFSMYCIYLVFLPLFWLSFLLLNMIFFLSGSVQERLWPRCILPVLRDSASRNLRSGSQQINWKKWIQTIPLLHDIWQCIFGWAKRAN